MEPRKCTTVSAVGARPARRPRERRAPLAFHTLLERLLVVLGLVLLAVYVAAKIHGAVLSRAAVQRFEELKQAVPGNNSPGDAALIVSVREEPRTRSNPELVSRSKGRSNG